jgi:hypothetical protein
MTYISNDFPTSIQNPSSPTANTEVATFDHAGLETFQNESIKALKDKVGANGSDVTTSHDYKLSEITSTDKAVGKSATQTLTNKTITGIANTITGLPETSLSLSDNTTNNVSTSRHGFAPKLPNDSTRFLDGTGNYSVPAGQSSYPELFSNLPSVGSSQSFLHSFSDANNGLCRISSTGTTISFHSSLISGGYQTRNVTSDWASANSILAACLVGDFLYVLILQTSTAYRVYRYSKTNLSAGGTLMTFSGQSLAFNNNTQEFTSNGTDFFFNNKAGNSSNTYVVSRYTLSGTTFTYVSDITCGSTANDVAQFAQVDSSNNIYGYNSSTREVKLFNSSGTLQRTYNALPTYTGNVITFYCYGVVVYSQNAFDDVYAQKLYMMNRFYL